jgi:hypothetical protein
MTLTNSPSSMPHTHTHITSLMIVPHSHRCFYLPEWHNDPHELAKLNAIYQQRESAIADKILQVVVEVESAGRE